jgi:sec-independent protein translocase protein TatB
MFNIGPGELVVILLLALILLGPKRLPDAAKAVGKGLREFRRATEDLKGTLEQEIGSLDEPMSPEKPPPRPVVSEAVPVQKSLMAPATQEPPATPPTSEPPAPAPTSEPPTKV